MEAKTLGVTTPRKPVLSVSARKIKDNAADWHNLILKWETLSDAGFTTANNIANLKISLLSKDKIELNSSSPASNGNEEKMYPQYDKELEVLCEELQTTLDGLIVPTLAIGNAVGSYVPLKVSLHSEVWIGCGFYEHSAFAGIERCSRLILCMSCLSLRIISPHSMFKNRMLRLYSY
ncbi:cyclin dependent kinase 2 interacting protein, transcript variant X2 [Ictidomys tridecemlineatus]|uniref:cyclin-dependent kinase 2-interacting protein isoform X1 n=1 Tax=Ictidomys tridecemlineatus TaxID=43179 RepID=UPI0006833986|nr:cyclin-dependent kinase 2-interacting protein isoform X1 [Ictidomys tridecemlineatus]KAG3260320.1 cyclin dependent kinase 2 interacting protein, transcript variant X2 [Ictidomys tridecemlineatus]